MPGNGGSSWVSLRISSNSTPPEYITNVTGLVPSEYYHSGDHIRHNPRYGVLKTHVWLLDSGLPETTSAEEQIKHLINLMEPNWKQLKSLDIEMGFYCTFRLDDAQGGFGLSRTLVRKLARLSAQVEISILA